MTRLRISYSCLLSSSSCHLGSFSRLLILSSGGTSKLPYKPPLPSKVMSFRRLGVIDIDAMKLDIADKHDVNKLITKYSKNSCASDPMPTKILLQCTDTLIPTITSLINLSLSSGPMVEYLYQRLRGGFRRCLVMAGAMLATTGLLLASLITNCVQLGLCLSVAGLGANILSISLVITLSNQSGEAFGIFYGIGKSGYAFGMALVPLLADYLMGIYGWRGSLLIIAGIMAHLIPLALMVGLNVEGVPLGEFSAEASEDTALILGSSTGKRDEDVSNMNNVHSGKGRCKKGQSICSELYATGCRIIKDSIYNQDRMMVLLMFLGLVYAILNGGWYSFLIPRAVALIGKPTSRALYIAYSVATAAFIGRCSSGMLIGSKLFNGKCLFLFLTLLNIISLLVDTFVPELAVMIVTSFITSLTIAERNVLLLVICKERAHRSHFPVILASYEIVLGVGTFLGSSFSGFIADVSGTFNASFMFIAAVDGLVFCLMLTPIIIDKWQQHSID
ncbi:monocarboxylate transporter 6-like [Lytechinus pictus]|uniref:monocarboxylate transporter 6-like n=1 Tax=Lytechinus pictus TaxID=7653 RepID=UPI0030BA22C2